MLKNLIKKQENIPINDVFLDLQNPRYNDKLVQTEKKKWNEENIQKIIISDVKDIYESIRNQGVVDPIWVVELGSSKYNVIEGSRRIVTLRLLNNQFRPPPGIHYDRIRANILPKNTSNSDIDSIRILLQTGKKVWGPYNVSFVIDKFFRKGFDSSKIAKMMAKTKAFVERENRSFGLYKEYVEYLKQKKLDPDPRRYTYFQRAGDAVKKKFFSTRTGRREFFELITPHGNNKARIPSVAMRGGIYHFNKIAEDDQILNKFLNDPDMTVEDAMKMYVGKYITAKFPWAKKFIEISEKIQDMDPSGIQEFRQDKKIKNEIRTIYKFCKRILGA